MSERDYNIPAFDPMLIETLGKTRWPDPRHATAVGTPINHLETIWRLSKGQRALPEAHANDPIGIDLETGDQVLTDRKVWVEMEIYDEQLLTGGPVFEAPHASQEWGSKLGILLKARIRLQQFLHPQANGTTIAKWRVIRVKRVRPDPALDDILVWFPLHMWVGTVFTFEKQAARRTFVDSSGAQRTFSKKDVKLAAAHGRARPLFTLGYDRQSFESLKTRTGKGLLKLPDRRLAIHFYSAQSDIGGSAENKVTEGELIAKLKGHFGFTKAPGQGRRLLELNLSKLVNEAVEADLGTPPPPQVEVLTPTYKDVLGTPYMVTLSPAMGRVRQGAPMRAVAVHTGISFEPVNKGQGDTVHFVVMDGRGRVVKRLKTEQGILDHEFKEIGQMSGNALVNANFFMRWADHTFEEQGEFQIACLIKLADEDVFKGVRLDIEVGQTTRVVSKALEEGFQDGLADPWQVLATVRDYREGLLKVEKPSERKAREGKAPEQIDDQALGELLIYEAALLGVLKAGGAQGTIQFLPPEHQRMPIIRCEARHAPLDGTLPVSELRVSLVITATEDDTEILCKLIDWTNPVPPAQGMAGVYRGTHPTDSLLAVKNAIKSWVLQCGYPDGKIGIYVGEPFRQFFYDDKEQSAIDKAAEVIDYIAMGFAVVGMIAALVSTAPVSIPATVALYAAAAAAVTGSVASGMRIYDRHRHGVLSMGRRDVMDALDIVGNMFTAGSLRWAKGATVITRLGENSRAAKFVFFGEAYVDGISGLLIMEEHADQLIAISNSNNKGSDRFMQTLSVVRGMVVTGTMAVLNVRASRSDVDGLDIPDLDHRALQRKLHEVTIPGKTIDALDPPTKMRGDTVEGKKRVEVEPAVRKKGQLDPPVSVRLKPRPAGHTYQGPSEFQEAVTEVGASCNSNCKPRTERVGRAIFEHHQTRGDMLVALGTPGRPTHFFLSVPRVNQPDLLVDTSLYQFFKKKNGDALTDADLGQFGFKPFVGTDTELQFYLQELYAHPELSGKLFDKPSDLYDSIWGRRDLTVPEGFNGNTLGIRLNGLNPDGTPKVTAQFGMRRLEPIGDMADAAKINAKLNPQRMARHVESTQKPNDKGSFFDSLEDAQKVLDALHDGRAKVIGRTSGKGRGGKQLVISFSGQSGTFKKQLFEKDVNGEFVKDAAGNNTPLKDINGNDVFEISKTHLFQIKGGTSAKGGSTTSVVPSDPKAFPFDSP